jgi:uncharacterized protein DUF2637
MNDRPASGPRNPDPFPVLRVAALIAAILGVLVLLAAAIAASYPGIHQLARTAGMSVTVARIFPVIFDALLVVAIAAVLSLHGAGWWRRGYSWLITVLLLAAMAAGGVLHAVHPQIPHRPAAITAAVLPWALLLIAFSLLLSMLRQFRQPRSSRAAEPPAPTPAAAERRTRLDELLTAAAPAAARTSTVPITRPAPDKGTPTGTGWGEQNGTDPRAASNGTAGHTPPATSPSDTAAAGPDAPDSQAESADDTKPTASDAADSKLTDSSDGTGPVSAPDQADAAPDETTASDETPGGDARPADETESEAPASPAAGTIHVPQQPMRAPVPAPSPHFDRLRSTPTPPEDDTDPDA